MRCAAILCAWSITLNSAAATAWAGQAVVPAMVDTPSVTVLTGLTVPEFEAEMQLMNQALGVSCGHCHARGNFASEANPRKASARKMLELTKAINHQFFPDYKPVRPVGDESRLGKVTCFTCHQGLERPKSTP
jgi:hypothetical protein